MHLLGHAGALPAEEDRIVSGKCEMMQWDGPSRRHQDQPRLRGPACEERRPRNMTADDEIGRIIEDNALEPPVIEQKTARLDQIDGYPETRRQPQQGPSVLRNVRFEQGETHTTSGEVFEAV
jgi:hypothetical protein